MTVQAKPLVVRFISFNFFGEKSGHNDSEFFKNTEIIEDGRQDQTMLEILKVSTKSCTFLRHSVF
jgi:hypothetical protein